MTQETREEGTEWVHLLARRFQLVETPRSELVGLPCVATLRLENESLPSTLVLET